MRQLYIWCDDMIVQSYLTHYYYSWRPISSWVLRTELSGLCPPPGSLTLGLDLDPINLREDSLPSEPSGIDHCAYHYTNERVVFAYEDHHANKERRVSRSIRVDLCTTISSPSIAVMGLLGRILESYNTSSLTQRTKLAALLFNQSTKCVCPLIIVLIPSQRYWFILSHSQFMPILWTITRNLLLLQDFKRCHITVGHQHLRNIAIRRNFVYITLPLPGRFSFPSGHLNCYILLTDVFTNFNMCFFLKIAI